MMMDDEFDGMCAGSGESDASSLCGKSARSKKTSKAKKAGSKCRTPPAAAYKKAKNKESKAQLCFVCPLKIQARKRFCSKHQKDYNAMEYQAKRDDKLDAFNNVMSDETQAGKALADFARRNPDGAFRKKPIEWTQFEKTYSKELVGTLRRGEEEWAFTEFKLDRCKGGGRNL